MNKTCGVYKITNILNNKYYIGSSKCIEYRFTEHKRKLNRKTHWNNHLQNSWNKYGNTNFIFEIIEVCDFASLRRKEQLYLDLAKYDTLCFNLNFSSNCCLFTEETRNKMSKARIGRFLGKNNTAYKNISKKIKNKSKKIWVKYGKNILISFLRNQNIGGTVAVRLINEFRKIKSLNSKRISNLKKQKKTIFSKNKLLVNSGKKNPNYNHNIFNLVNKKTNEIFIGTLHEFKTKFGFYLNGYFLKNKRKSCKKWIKTTS